MIERWKHYWNRRQLRNQAYAYLFEPCRQDEVVVLDTETTGLNPRRDAILSVGAVVIKDGKIQINHAFERLVRPERDISEESIKIHRLRSCDLAQAESAETVIQDLLAFIKNRPIVGYYIRFDHAIVSRYTRSLIGVSLPNPMIELSSMYYRRFRKHSAYEMVDLKFDTMMQTLGIPMLGKHDALNDALMSAMMYLKLKSMPEYKGAYA